LKALIAALSKTAFEPREYRRAIGRRPAETMTVSQSRSKEEGVFCEEETTLGNSGHWKRLRATAPPLDELLPFSANDRPA
jgi:hypothetical protein